MEALAAVITIVFFVILVVLTERSDEAHYRKKRMDDDVARAIQERLRIDSEMLGAMKSLMREADTASSGDQSRQINNRMR